MERWRVSGHYFESCNCGIPCPCVFGPNPVPSEGFCQGALAWHVREGYFGAARLDAVTAVLAFRTPPGPFRAGGWTAALYVDARADAAQRAALAAIFQGKAGGGLERLAALVGTWLAVEPVPMTVTIGERRRTLAIPDILEAAIEGVAGRTGAEITVDNPWHGTAKALIVAKGERSWYRGVLGRWDNTGRSGYYATFAFANEL